MRSFRYLALVFALAIPAVANGQTCPFPAATPTTPLNGATNVAVPVLFQWNAAAGTSGYEVWAKAEGDDEFILLGETTETNFVDWVPPETKVEWYVVAKFATCSTESQHFAFTSRPCPTTEALLFAPADFSKVSSPVTFSWSSVPNALFYRVWVGVEIEGELQLFVVDEPTRTTSTVRLPPNIYPWFVESVFECDSSYSEVRVFEIPRAANCPTSGATLVSPADGATISGPVTFMWNPVPGAIGYQVWVALDDGDFDFVGETTSGTSLQANLGEGSVRWVVVTQFNGCDDIESRPGSFTIPVNPDCDTAPAFTISPADGDFDVPTKVSFIWTPVDGATAYKVWVSVNGGNASVIGTTTSTRLAADVPPGDIVWYVESDHASCPPDLSAESRFQASVSAVCKLPDVPNVYVDPEAMSGDEYIFIWSPGLNTQSYEVQEATKENFTDATTRTVSDIIVTFSHAVKQPTRYFYRVRSMSSCGLGFGPYSEPASIVITPSEVQSADSAEASTAFGTQRMVVQTVHIPGSGSSTSGKTALSQSFTATTDKPWLTVSPSSGVIPPQGIDLTVTSDPRDLPAGSSTGTIRLTTTASEGPTSVPVSVNLVTPVSPNAGTAPTPSSLIIPAVAHALGAGTKFESDVRLANTSPQVMKYLLNFTPTLSDGTKTGQQATIQVDAGETIALNDILKNFYGFATESDNISGVLEIRPLTTQSAGTSASSVTFASSRTYATGPAGTYGQFIPAISFSQFVGKSNDPAKPTVLSLQQIAKSASYRTNIGLVEAAGQPANVVLTVFDERGGKIGDITKSLKPGEHMQFPLDIAVENGRIELSVTSATGKVTAYASVVDNKTNDPLLVFPVNTAEIRANRYILPGIADLKTGANWRSDVRVYNAGTIPITATLTYYPQPGNRGASAPAQIQLAAGEMRVINNALQSLFGVTDSGGSLAITTPTNSKLVATARTYNDTGSGTYGQFIPGVTVAEGVAAGNRALQILQVEESDRFYTNVGVVELSGNPVTVEISAYTPDSKVAAKTQISLGANEFVQLGHILRALNLPTTYNARVAMRVTGGNGRISGYGSLIDNRTKDPTYVPAQ